MEMVVCRSLQKSFGVNKAQVQFSGSNCTAQTTSISISRYITLSSDSGVFVMSFP